MHKLALNLTLAAAIAVLSGAAIAHEPARLVGYGCEGAPHGIMRAVEEDEFTRCAFIVPEGDEAALGDAILDYSAGN